MFPYVDEQTDTKYCSSFSSGLGHSPTIAFINKGFVELVRTTPPVFPSACLAVALPKGKSERLPCVLLFTESKDRCPTVRLTVANTSKYFIMPKRTCSQVFSFVFPSPHHLILALTMDSMASPPVSNPTIPDRIFARTQHT